MVKQIEKITLGATSCVFFWWFLAVSVPWYQYTVDISYGDTKTHLNSLCFIDGTCSGHDVQKQIDQLGSGDIQGTFDATATFMLMGFFLFFPFLALLVYSFYKNQNCWIPIAIMGVILGLFLFLTIIIFPAGISAQQSGMFSGSQTIHNGLITTKTTFGPNGGWALTFLVGLFFIPTSFLIYKSNQLDRTFEEYSGL